MIYRLVGCRHTIDQAGESNRPDRGSAAEAVLRNSVERVANLPKVGNPAYSSKENNGKKKCTNNENPKFKEAFDFN